MKENDIKKYSLKNEQINQTNTNINKTRNSIKPNTCIILKNQQNLENNSPFLQEIDDKVTKSTFSPKNVYNDQRETPKDLSNKLINSPYYSKTVQAEEQAQIIKIKEKTEVKTGRDPIKQYNTRIIKSKKCDIETLEYVLRTKFTNNHKVNMEEYIKKVGLNENTKVFCCNTQDEHLRRALLNLGWYENKNINSFFFDLKWVYIDNENDYKFLIDGQFYNHFQNNKELTTKIGLTNNLKEFSEYGVNFDEFYPRCYDLGNDKDLMEFSADFEHTNMMILLKKHIKYFKLKKKNLIKEIKMELKINEEKKKTRNDKVILMKMIKRKPKN